MFLREAGETPFYQFFQIRKTKPPPIQANKNVASMWEARLGNSVKQV